MAELNKGLDMEVYNGFKEKVLEDRTNADRDKTAVARWVQGEETRVVLGDNEVTLGADDGLSSMEMLLTSFAGCDAAMVALHASFMGLKVKSVTVEVNGHYNVAAYLGIEDVPGAGYDRMSTKVYIDAPDATPEQLAYLKHICETGSPVGDSLTGPIPIDLEIIATAEQAEA